MAAKRENNSHEDVDSAHPQALTRRNMRDFNRADRQEEARKNGVPTSATKNSGREYRTSQSSLNKEAVPNIAQECNTEAPAEKANIDKAVFRKASSEKVVKPFAKPKARQGPSPDGKQKLLEEKAERKKMAGLNLVTEEESREDKEKAEAGKRQNTAEGSTKQQPGVSIRSPRASTKQKPGKLTVTEGQPTDVASLFPPEFPRFQSVQKVNDIGAYLANASYIVSVGGPPVSDLKYGVILVPLGEERLLFGKQPDNAETQSPGKGGIEAKGKTPSRAQEAGQPVLHALGEDSAQVRRPRFAPREHNIESIASPVVQSPVRNGEDKVGAIGQGKGQAVEDTQGLQQAANGNAVDVEGDTQMSEEGHSTQDGSVKPAGAQKKKKQGSSPAAPARTRRNSSRQTASKPQGVVKKMTAVMKKASSSAENSERPRALRSRRPLPG